MSGLVGNSQRHILSCRGSHVYSLGDNFKQINKRQIKYDTVMILSFGTEDFGKQCRPRSDYSSDLVLPFFAILSASSRPVTLCKTIRCNFRIITTIFLVSEFFGFFCSSCFELSYREATHSSKEASTDDVLNRILKYFLKQFSHSKPHSELLGQFCESDLRC